MAHPIRKRFGQHFLTDSNIIQRIVSAINIQPDDNIIEIGPGLGAMTLPLLRDYNFQNYLALEIDRDAIQSLSHSTKGIEKFSIQEADALKTNFLELLKSVNKVRVIGNLPYNISTPLIFHLLNYQQRISDMVFMLQKEVVVRMCAEPNSKTYGRLSVMVQAHCQAENLFEVPPSAFNPPPKVDSAIVKLTPLNEKLELKDSILFANIVREAFRQRRKTIRNSMRNFLEQDDFNELGLDAKARAENLSVGEFIKASNYVFQKQKTL